MAKQYFTDFSRRDFFKMSLASAFGLSCSGWLQSLAEGADSKKRMRSCILLWMNGGASQFETFDIHAGVWFVIAAIVNGHFLHQEVTHMFGLIATTLGGNVDKRLIKISQKFEICFNGLSLQCVCSNQVWSLLHYPELAGLAFLQVP